jgi:hypothetical protein
MNGAKRVYHRAMGNKSRTAAWIVVAVIAVLVAQQAPFVIRGDYSRRVVWESTSPDQRYRLEVKTQATFPAWHDPSGMAYFTAINSSTGQPVAGIAVPIHRFFDFKRPTVQWSSEDVQAVNFDQRQPASVRLLLAH